LGILPKEGLMLVDDISKQNMALITRLRSSQHFESVWYFNCAVHAKTLAGGFLRSGYIIINYHFLNC
jgi:hypothetical protein